MAKSMWDSPKKYAKKSKQLLMEDLRNYRTGSYLPDEADVRQQQSDIAAVTGGQAAAAQAELARAGGQGAMANNQWQDAYSAQAAQSANAAAQAQAQAMTQAQQMDQARMAAIRQATERQQDRARENAQFATQMAAQVASSAMPV